MALLEIVELNAPDEAQAGSWVSFSTRIRNNSTGSVFVAAMLFFWDGTQWILTHEFDAYISGGATRLYVDSFVMPAVDSAVFVHAWRMENGVWVLDDGDSKPIAVYTVGSAVPAGVVDDQEWSKL